MDLEGNLLFYNEPAEAILGLRYEESGELPLSEWATVFVPTNEEGNELPPDDLPLVITVRKATGARCLLDNGTRRRPAPPHGHCASIDRTRHRDPPDPLPFSGVDGE